MRGSFVDGSEGRVNVATCAKFLVAGSSAA